MGETPAIDVLLPLSRVLFDCTLSCFQVRQRRPDATECTEEDALELMEMILGALGRDAVGLGASMAHPRER